MIGHYELCKITAERFIKESDVVLFEYQSYATEEFPDVLCFNGGYTTIFEIKVNYQDFLKDEKKECRIKYEMKYFTRWYLSKDYDRILKIAWNNPILQEFRQEAPHLGKQRYLVCPKDLIQPEKVNNGWGLYWWNKKFYMKKESRIFRNDIHAELKILTHAMRKEQNGHGDNILVKPYRNI